MTGRSVTALSLLALVLGLSHSLLTEVPDCTALRDCKCQVSGQIFGISCENLTDFVDFRQKIDDIFEANETFEIVLQNTVSLPARAIERFIVYKLFVDGTLAEVSDRVFEGVYRIRKFHVISSVLRKIPDFSLVPHSLRSVNIDNSFLSEVQGEFRNLPLLKHLSLRNNSISMVTEDAFRGSNIIRTLDLSYNRLVSLPKSLLDELENLRKLDLSHNQLITLDGNLNNNNPKFLLLHFNNLTSIDNVLHHNMKDLIVLYLDHNPLGKITNQTFKWQMPSLSFLYIDHTNLTEFDIDPFRSIQNISFIDVSGNHVTQIGNQYLGLWGSGQFVFDGNVIQTFEGNVTSGLKYLSLIGNRLTLLNNIFQNAQTIVEVDLSRNRLIAIEEHNFAGVKDIFNMMFRSNFIERIDRESFISVRNDLHTLDLSDNRLRNLNGSVQFLSQLKSLNVSYNHLDVFNNIEFVGLNELTELYVQHNRIIVLTGELQKMPQLQFLNLQRNQIKTLDPAEIPQSLEYLLIKDNPIECDCRIQPFLLQIETHHPVETDIELCQSLEEPSSSASPCPDPCLCSCTHDANGSYVSMDCSSSHLRTIPPFSNSPSDPFFVRISNSQFVISDQVLAMDFENNNISTLKDIPFPSNLKKLYLANNLLNSLPQSVMHLRGLNRLTLARNPWTCDCSTVETRRWMLSKMEEILDVNATQCHSNQNRNSLNDLVIVALSDVDLCPSNLGLYIGLGIGFLSFLLLIAILKITYTRYQMNIKAWLYSQGVTWVKEKDTDEDKPFDAFVSYSHKDEDFVVNHLVAGIENCSSSVRLCLHYRHFLPGEFIHENIMNASKNSKRTVLVLSRNFLESEWCLMEFRTAHLQALEDKVHRIIVIKMPHLPETLDPAVKVFLDYTTYVTWGEKHFWQKLIYVLPEESKTTHRASAVGDLELNISQETGV